MNINIRSPLPTFRLKFSKRLQITNCIFLHYLFHQYSAKSVCKRSRSKREREKETHTFIYVCVLSWETLKDAARINMQSSCNGVRKVCVYVYQGKGETVSALCMILISKKFVLGVGRGEVDRSTDEDDDQCVDKTLPISMHEYNMLQHCFVVCECS